MIRTKMTLTRRRYDGNPELSPMGKLLVSCLYLSKIPGLKRLRKYLADSSGYHDYSGEQWDSHKYDEIKCVIQDWLSDTDPDTVFADLTNLFRTRQKTFFNTRNLVDQEYEHHFNRVLKFKNLPSKMFRPAITFFPSNDKLGTMNLAKPYRKKIGKTTIIFSGAVLQGYDIKTLFALSDLMMRKPCMLRNGEFIKLTTSYQEICKEMFASNRWDKKQHKAIQNSLIRLRDCGISWKDAKGHTILSGVLVKAKEIEPDSTGSLEIFFDYDFITLFDTGCVMDLNRRLLYKMSDKELAVCMFLATQECFVKYGRYPDPRYNKYEKLTTFYEKLNLEGVTTNETKKAMVRFELKSLLKNCKEKILGDYRLTKEDQLRIEGQGEVFNSETTAKIDP